MNREIEDREDRSESSAGAYLKSLLAALLLSPALLSGYIAAVPENFEKKDYGVWATRSSTPRPQRARSPGC